MCTYHPRFETKFLSYIWSIKCSMHYLQKFIFKRLTLLIIRLLRCERVIEKYILYNVWFIQNKWKLMYLQTRLLGAYSSNLINSIRIYKFVYIILSLKLKLIFFKLYCNNPNDIFITKENSGNSIRLISLKALSKVILECQNSSCNIYYQSTDGIFLSEIYFSSKQI